MQAVARIDGEQLQQQRKEAAKIEEEKWLEVLFKFAGARLAAGVCGHKKENVQQAAVV